MVLRKNLRDIGAAGLNSSEPRETVLGHHLDSLSVSELSFTFCQVQTLSCNSGGRHFFSRYTDTTQAPMA